ncbi:MAG: UTRA domain-containing protein [Rhizobiaceae bacterium]|nr:MAG: UTRA domain-containing protein [Rhizobiaceae bacterium]
MKPTSRSSYRDIRAEISRRIGERVWVPGALIPGEEVLALEFGCARATVNRALQDLARSGLVERRRKAGTRVALHPVREARFVIPLVRQEVEARGAAYRYRLLSRETALPPELVQARLGLGPDAELLHVRLLHLAANAPYLYEDRWINLDAVPAAREADFEAENPNEWLVGHAPFSHAEYGFLAARSSAEEAELLQIPVAESVLVSERLTWLLDKPITLVRMVYPPGHRIVTRL